MQKYDYQDRLFDIYAKTFCTRKQVELAAKELGFEQAQKLHFKKTILSDVILISSLS